MQVTGETRVEWHPLGKVGIALFVALPFVQVLLFLSERPSTVLLAALSSLWLASIVLMIHGRGFIHYGEKAGH